METFNKSWAFASFFVLSCAFTEVQSGRKGSNSSEPYNPYYYEKERNPINTARDYNYMPRNIQGNIDRHMNDSDVSVHFFEDKSDLNDEFKNETYFKKEYLENKTDDEFFRLENENLNQTQSLNFTQYLRVFNDSSNTKQSTLHVKGNSKTTDDFYSDRNLVTNVSLRTYDDESETVDVDKVRQVEEVRKKFSSLGNLRYQRRNHSDSEIKEKFEHFVKRKHFFKDSALEKDFQNSFFNQSKNIDQTNEGKRNMEKEQVLKSKSQDYEKNAAGVETLRRDCLSHLEQESIYGDGKTEVKYAKSQKNRKTGFSKRLNTQTPEGGKWVTYQKFLQDCYDLLPESSVSDMTIPNGDDSNSRVDPFSNDYSTLPKPFQPNVQNFAKGDFNHQNGRDRPNKNRQDDQNIPKENEQEYQDHLNEDQQKHQDYSRRNYKDDQDYQNEYREDYQDYLNKDQHDDQDNPGEDHQEQTNEDEQNNHNHPDVQGSIQAPRKSFMWQSNRSNQPLPSLQSHTSKYSDAEHLGDRFFPNGNLTTADVKNPIASQETTLLDASYDVHLRNHKTVIQKSTPKSQNESPNQTSEQHRNPYYSDILEDLDDLLKEFQSCSKCEEDDAECKKSCERMWESLKSQGEPVEQGVESTTEKISTSDYQESFGVNERTGIPLSR